MPSPSQYVQHLTEFMATLRCTPPIHHATPPVYIDKSLADCTHVFVRVDASRPSLSPPYAGPYKVLVSGGGKPSLGRGTGLGAGFRT